MNSKPSVSSIVPFLNAEKFIREAVESVFAQTYDNWELLLVDDGSTDGSTQIALQYAEQYPEKVRYLEHPGRQNRGASASRNLGLVEAQGEYIAFLDADDVWLPHKLEQQVAILASHPEAAMLYGNTEYWYSWTGDSEDKQRDVVPELVARSNTLFKPPTLLTLSYPLGRATAPSLSNLLFRREMVERTGAFEESFKRVYTDQAFLIKIYLKESVFVASESENWDRYRQHPDSCGAVVESTGQYYSARLIFLKWLAEYLYEQGVEDIGVWKLLQEAQFETHRKQLRVRNERVKELKGALEKERRKVQRLRKQDRQWALRVQNQEQKEGSRAWKLWERLNYLRARLLGR